VARTPYVDSRLLTLRVDPKSPLAKHRQIYEALRKAILDGRLEANEALLSTRQASRILGVSRNTVLAAYDLLLAEGCLVSRGVPARLSRSTRSGRRRMSKWYGMTRVRLPQRRMPWAFGEVLILHCLGVRLRRRRRRLPPDLVDSFICGRRILDRLPNSTVQGGLAEFMERGLYANRVHKMRAVYAERPQLCEQRLTANSLGCSRRDRRPREPSPLRKWSAD